MDMASSVIEPLEDLGVEPEDGRMSAESAVLNFLFKARFTLYKALPRTRYLSGRLSGAYIAAGKGETCAQGKHGISGT